MIIELLLTNLFNVFKLLTTPINIPPLPEQVSEFLTQAMEYISAGAGILANYTHLDYLLILLGVIVAIDIGVAVYHFVLWVIKKIPMLGMS